jgi:hypothetical protein
MGRVLVGLGLLLVLTGLIVMAVERWTGGGRGLPGDITFRWGNVTVYLPLGTSILISLILSAIFFILNAAQRR